MQEKGDLPGGPASNSGGMGSIPAQGTKILHATQHGQKINKDTERMQWIEFDVGCVEFNGPVDHSSRRAYQMGTWKHYVSEGQRRVVR